MIVGHICTWGSCFWSHHSSLQSSMLPDTDHGYYAPLRFSVLRLQCFSLVAPFPLWGSLSPLVFYRCLQCSGWALSSQPLRYRCLLDFSILKVMVFGSALQLETCYGVVALPCLLSAKTYIFPPKLAASSVAAGPCSNNDDDYDDEDDEAKRRSLPTKQR